MAKLVVLSAGLNGRTHELNVDKTTIGRVEDNTFQIADPSVSSHHCEVLLRGSDVVIKDLNSTNGSFINGEKISESSFETRPDPAPRPDRIAIADRRHAHARPRSRQHPRPPAVPRRAPRPGGPAPRKAWIPPWSCRAESI